jgi:hypothetical protein
LPLLSIDGRVSGLYCLERWYFYGLEKIQTIVDWIVLSSVWDVQCFLDFANFNRIFIKDYSKIAAPLTRLIGKDKCLWNEKAEESLEALKKAFTSVLILIYPDSSKPFFLKVYVSNFSLG